MEELLRMFRLKDVPSSSVCTRIVSHYARQFHFTPFQRFSDSINDTGGEIRCVPFVAQPNSPRGNWCPCGTRLYGNCPKGGKVQWGEVRGAHASRQGKPGLTHQQSKLKEGVD
jgi:hypothetical protein